MNKIKSIEKFLIKEFNLIIGLSFMIGWIFTFKNIVDIYGYTSIVFDLTVCISLAIFGILYIILSVLENIGGNEK